MMKSKNRMMVFLLLFLTFSYLLYMNTTVHRRISEDNARRRVEGFIQAVNNNQPAIVYQYLTPEIKKIASKKEFIRNFAKERSYPYLTPLYLYLDKLHLNKDKMKGIAECIVAARLPGEKMTFHVVFVEDNYYIAAFKEIADGSFREKFAKLQTNEGEILLGKTN